MKKQYVRNEVDIKKPCERMRKHAFAGRNTQQACQFNV